MIFSLRGPGASSIFAIVSPCPSQEGPLSRSWKCLEYYFSFGQQSKSPADLSYERLNWLRGTNSEHDKCTRRTENGNRDLKHQEIQSSDIYCKEKVNDDGKRQE